MCFAPRPHMGGGGGGAQSDPHDTQLSGGSAPRHGMIITHLKSSGFVGVNFDWL